MESLWDPNCNEIQLKRNTSSGVEAGQRHALCRALGADRPQAAAGTHWRPSDVVS